MIRIKRNTHLIPWFLFVLVAMGTVVEETYSDFTEEDQTPLLDYKSTESLIIYVYLDEPNHKSGP